LTAEILLALGMLEVFEEMIYFEDQDDVEDSTDDVGLELQTQISPLTTPTTIFDVTPTTSRNAAVLPPVSSQLYASGDNISHISTSTKNNGTQAYYFSRWDLQEAGPHLPGVLTRWALAMRIKESATARWSNCVILEIVRVQYVLNMFSCQ
jgi:hypothetical protein